MSDQRESREGEAIVKDSSSRLGLVSSSRMVTLLVLFLLEVLWIFGLGTSLVLTTLLRVNDTYLVPQLTNLVWDDARKHAETTYYPRVCDRHDLSAHSPQELRLDPETSTADDAYQHFLKHGFTLFPNVIDRETATALRDVVVQKNNRQSKEEAAKFAEFLWSPEHRYSVDLGTADGTAVGKAMAAIASNPLFRSSLEKIMGKNPAVIEFNSITSEYLAEDQDSHSDGKSNGSAMNYARSYGPTHVLLMQLQDTTEGMGATHVCPGTHFCTEGTFVEDCEEEGQGFQVPSSAGDGMLMNTNAWHRGMAFTDASKKDTLRVMIALTFTPQPLARAETRVPSQELSFSMEWYMYGHTMNDMAALADRWARTSTSLSTRPWTDLRALGMYHGPVVGQAANPDPNQQKALSTITSAQPVTNKNWGFDYVTLQLIRYTSEVPVGHFDPEGVPQFLQEGGFSPWLPMALHARVPEGKWNNQENEEPFLSWHDFYVITAQQCQRAAQTLYTLSLIAFCLVGGLHGMKKPFTNPRVVLWAVLHLALLHITLLGLYHLENQRIDDSPWARDIIKGDRYKVHFPQPNAEKPSRGMSDYALPPGLPTVYPDKNDVLIETRYGSRELEMYNDFIDRHPGNLFWRQRLMQLAPAFRGYQRSSSVFPMFGTTLAQNIVEWTEVEHSSRFLYQDISTGDWKLLPKADAIKITLQELHILALPSLPILAKELRFFQSECLYGHLRETAMCRIHVPDFISKLRRALGVTVASASTLVQAPPIPKSLRYRHAPTYQPTKLGNKRVRNDWESRRQRRKATDKPEKKVVRRKSSVFHIMEGDLVEAQEAYGESVWLAARVVRISGDGTFEIMFLDGSDVTMSLTFEEIRPFVPYTEGLLDGKDNDDENNNVGYDDNDVDKSPSHHHHRHHQPTSRVQFFVEYYQQWVPCRVLEEHVVDEAFPERTTYTVATLHDGAIFERVGLDVLSRTH